MPENAPSADSAPVSEPAFLVRALRHRNYRLFFSGGGIGCLLGALWFASRLPTLRERVVPIYTRLGILPEVPAISPITAGIQSATELAVPPER